MKPQTHIKVAWALLACCLVGWPLSLYFFTDEPPIVMSLSWLALVYTAYDTIITANVNQEMSDGNRQK